MAGAQTSCSPLSQPTELTVLYPEEMAKWQNVSLEPFFEGKKKNIWSVRVHDSNSALRSMNCQPSKRKRKKQSNLPWIVVKQRGMLAPAQRLFLCRLKSRPCGWDKMYSDSTATIWVISLLLIPLHLFRSDFIHLQIALRRRVLLGWGMNCALSVLCFSTIC